MSGEEMAAFIKRQTVHVGIVPEVVGLDKVIVVTPDRVNAVWCRVLDVLKGHGGGWRRDHQCPFRPEQRQRMPQHMSSKRITRAQGCLHVMFAGKPADDRQQVANLWWCVRLGGFFCVRGFPANALARANTAKVKAHNAEVMVQQSAGSNMQYAVVHAAAVKWVGVTQYGNVARLIR